MHIYIEKPSLAKCPRCGREVLPHTLCWNCGYYKGREVINVLEKLNKKEKKKREKEIAIQEKGGGRAEKPTTLEELSKK